MAATLLYPSKRCSPTSLPVRLLRYSSSESGSRDALPDIHSLDGVIESIYKINACRVLRMMVGFPNQNKIGSMHQ